MSRIFVCGDTHGSIDIAKLGKKNWVEQKELNENDVLIILGDFGLFWYGVETKEEKYWLNWLLDKSIQIAFIDGNHEAFPRFDDNRISDKWNGKVQICKSNDKQDKHIYRLRRGEVYNIGNKTIFTMGGALSIDKHLRTEHISWWKEEAHSYQDWYNADANLYKHKNCVDYILTHTCPFSIAKKMNLFYYQNTFIDPAMTSFDNLLKEKIKFKQWHFGHFHRDNGNLPLVYKDKFFSHYNNIPFELI